MEGVGMVLSSIGSLGKEAEKVRFRDAPTHRRMDACTHKMTLSLLDLLMSALKSSKSPTLAESWCYFLID